MISFEDAKEIAARYVSAFEPGAGMELMLIDGATLERDLGWVFFYNSRSFLETGNFRDALVGNAPIIVDRRDAKLYVTGTANPIEDYIRDFEQERGKSG